MHYVREIINYAQYFYENICQFTVFNAHGRTGEVDMVKVVNCNVTFADLYDDHSGWTVA